MEETREKIQPLYDKNALLGFARFDADGNLLGNDTFFSDEAVCIAVSPFFECVEQLGASNRKVNRLTVELEELRVVYVPNNDGSNFYLLPLGDLLDDTIEALEKIA